MLVAVIMGFLAWHTWQTVQVRGERLELHQAMNRLVLARACALGGALIAAGYVGYAVSWLGDDVPVRRPLDRSASVVAALGGARRDARLPRPRACVSRGRRSTAALV